MIDDTQFNRVFSESSPLVTHLARLYSKKSGVPEAEFISQLNEEVWLAYNKHDPTRTTISTWLYTSLTSRAKRVASRGEYKFYSKLRYTETKKDESDSCLLQIEDEHHVEQEVIDKLGKKREDDQRQLIAFLSDPSQVDSDTTLIVSNFSQHDSITALAKALGMHHETVKRKLRKLARRYDANRFGDINEYLAV
jgi:hypothetical protein